MRSESDFGHSRQPKGRAGGLNPPLPISTFRTESAPRQNTNQLPVMPTPCQVNGKKAPRNGMHSPFPEKKTNLLELIKVTKQVFSRVEGDISAPRIGHENKRDNKPKGMRWKKGKGGEREKGAAEREREREKRPAAPCSALFLRKLLFVEDGDEDDGMGRKILGMQGWSQRGCQYAGFAAGLAAGLAALLLLLTFRWIQWQAGDDSFSVGRLMWNPYDNLPPVEAGDTNAPPEDPAIPDEYLAACLAVKDQGLDLPEWLKHHYHNMGFKHFYIMDDGSEPPLSTMIDRFDVPEEALTFVYFTPEQRVPLMQRKVYDECIHNYGKNHTWFAFIDADEFFDVPGNETLLQILKGLEPLLHVGALGVNWQVHTSSGRLTRADSVLSAYTECLFDDEEHNGEGSENKHIKSIVRASAYAIPQNSTNPHKFCLRDNAITVGEFGDEVTHYAFRQPITRKRVSLHHYALKSRQEFEEKIQRSNGVSIPRTWQSWNDSESAPHVECKDMLKWAGK